MKKSYLCPACKSHLKLRDKVILTVFKNEQQRGLILLSPEIGDYDITYHSESTGLAKGDKVDVFCPVCSVNLDAGEKYKNLAKLIMVDETGKKSEVYFSKIIGEQATYKVTDQKIQKFGEDAANYNYWGYFL